MKTSKSWSDLWLEHFFRYAVLVSSDNPLPVGWCVYVEPMDWD